MTVYIDIVLIENLLMDYIILFATGKINRCKINHVRLIVASLVGSAYAVVLFISNIEVYANVMLKILLSASMIYIAFTPKNMKSMIKELLVFYLTSFALGGCAFALLYFIKPGNIFSKDGFLIGYDPLKIVFLAGIVGFIITTYTFKIIKEKFSKNNRICEITIGYKGNTTTTKSMIDTGNMLKDPISKTAVIVVETSALYEIIPGYLLQNIDRIIGGELESMCKQEEIDDYRVRFRVIPFNSLGRENGLLLAFKPDNIKINWEENSVENIKALIGLYDKKLSKSGEYNALVGFDCLTEG